jgi:hypothetical protein
VSELKVPHRVLVSFDWAQCPCGWQMVLDNPEALRVSSSAHEEAYEGHLIDMEVYEP